MRGRLQPSQWGWPSTDDAYRDVCTVHTEYLPIVYSRYLGIGRYTHIYIQPPKILYLSTGYLPRYLAISLVAAAKGQGPS